jgi:hypothetical protein
MQTISISVGPELFTIPSFELWKYRAKEQFDGCGHHYRRTIAVDARGRVCATGREFMRARDSAAFPIRVYGIAEEPEPGGVLLDGAHQSKGVAEHL